MISFIVPAHNEEALLGRTLASIHASAAPLGRPYEVLVVNDSSTDRTREIGVQNGARVIDVSHRQIAATRNSGARAATGDCFIFVDADTTITPHVVRAAARALANGAVGGGALVHIDGKVPAYGVAIELILRLVAPVVGLAGGCFLFCTRATYLAAGGFDEELFVSEEVGFASRLKAQGKFVMLRSLVTTSGRKLREYSGLGMLRLFLRVAAGGTPALRRREGLEFWYGPRKADPGSTPL